MNVSMILSAMTHLLVAMRSVLILASVLLMLIVRPNDTKAFALANQATEAMLT
jgi:competence protein ComGC